MLGRRGPAQAAFTSAELRELGHMDGVDLVVDPAEAQLDVVSAEWLDRVGHVHRAAQRQAAARVRRSASRDGAPRAGIVLRFLRSPVAIGGDGPRRVASTIARNELHRDEGGAIRARSTDDTETIECGLVLRSVGYRAVPLPDVPFDERNYVLPNEQGRVVDADTRRSRPRRLRRRLDQARPDRHPRHQQARRRRRPSTALLEDIDGRCPSAVEDGDLDADATPSPPRAGARSTPPRSRPAKPRTARG